MARKQQNPVIVVPGITATDLLDEYDLDLEVLWSMVMNKRFDRITLHPDDLRFEAKEPARVRHGQAFSIYHDLVRALRHELSPRADQETPVFLFPYDWRKDVRLTARDLSEFVREVLARTSLMRQYSRVGGLRVDLVGHSMGGLVITEYLAQTGQEATVGKVVTLGAPFRGSIEAVVKLATGLSRFGGHDPREREREAARVTPSVYQLLPSYEGAALAVGQTTGRVDVFDARQMQGSVLKSLTEFVRMYSSNTRADDREARAGDILKALLTGGKEHRRTVERFRLDSAALRPGDWLTIVGIGELTRVEVVVDYSVQGPRFRICDDQFANEADSVRTGDGTVPVLGAVPPFLPESSLVCVKRSDLSFWELQDRAMLAVAGLHALLPSVNLVQRLIARHLRPSFRGEVWGRRVPGATRWDPPIGALAERA